jgi:hypothetical protein
VSLFPEAQLHVLLPGGELRAGARVTAILEIHAPAPIPRAQAATLVLSTVAWAGYGGGKNRQIVRRTMYEEPLRHEIRSDVPLGAGTHTIELATEVPAWLPPNLDSQDAGISTMIEARLDVDWAKDPTSRVAPRVALPPSSAERTPVRVRSDARFHDTVVVEVALDSSTIAHDEMLSGRVAVRGAEGARFDALVITMRSVATIAMAHGDRREGKAMTLRIAAADLAEGTAVPFAIRASDVGPPTFVNGYIDHDLVLDVALDIPWSRDPRFRVPLRVLPAGSTFTTEASSIALGNERLGILAREMAAASGLRVGTLPVLATADAAATSEVDVRVTDGPRDGKLGVDVDFSFPDVGLGFTFATRRLIDKLREAPLVPPAHRDRYFVRLARDEGKPAIEAAQIGSFLDVLVGDVGTGLEVRIDEHHLGLHFVPSDDNLAQMIDIAHFARRKVDRIAEAIAALPFPEGLASLADSWRAAARERHAFLVPSEPAIRGITLRARVVGGEQRTITAALRTIWRAEGPRARIDLDLEETPIPQRVFDAIDAAPHERLRALDTTFESITMTRTDHVVLQSRGLAADPGALLAGVDAFFAWLLEVRGERRAEGAYR